MGATSLDPLTANFKIVKISVFPDLLQATALIRKMRGSSHPVLVECNDNNLYVVKFQNNPQHIRILANEMLGGRLARLLGLPVPQGKCISVSSKLIKFSSSSPLDTEGLSVPYVPGLQFGTRYPGEPGQVLVMDFLPSEYSSHIWNPEFFLGALVFDKWTCHSRDRQMIFFRASRDYGEPFEVQMIDQGSCFNSAEWSFFNGIDQGLYPRREVYAAVHGLESFEPFLSAVENLGSSDLEACARDVPEEWYEGDKSKLDHLMEKLYLRRNKVRQAILDTRKGSQTVFPNWVLQVRTTGV